MAIPASVLTYINWQNTVSGGNYTTSSPERVASTAWAINGASTVTENDSPWNGARLLDCSASWSHGMEKTDCSSSDIQATSGRFLLEFEPIAGGLLPDSTAQPKIANAADTQWVLVRHQNDGADRLQVALYRATDQQYSELFLTYPTVAAVVEVKYDFNAVDSANWLQARVWNYGASPGSFTAGTPNGTRSTTDQFTYIGFSEPGNGDGRQRYGRFIISNDYNEDLSQVSESADVELMPQACL
jgi:hypothetical protein